MLSPVGGCAVARLVDVPRLLLPFIWTVTPCLCNPVRGSDGKSLPELAPLRKLPLHPGVVACSEVILWRSKRINRLAFGRHGGRASRDAPIWPKRRCEVVVGLGRNRRRRSRRGRVIAAEAAREGWGIGRGKRRREEQEQSSRQRQQEGPEAAREGWGRGRGKRRREEGEQSSRQRLQETAGG